MSPRRCAVTAMAAPAAVHTMKVAAEKAEKTNDEKDIQVAFEKMGEIIKIAEELDKRSSNGDKKAKEELDKWDEVIKELNIQF